MLAAEPHVANAPRGEVAVGGGHTQTLGLSSKHVGIVGPCMFMLMQKIDLPAVLHTVCQCPTTSTCRHVAHSIMMPTWQSLTRQQSALDGGLFNALAELFKVPTGQSQGCLPTTTKILSAQVGRQHLQGTPRFATARIMSAGHNQFGVASSGVAQL
jgi:hypothetical protein